MNEFTQKILDSHAYIINLDLATDRYKESYKNIIDAGFTRVERVSGVHICESYNEIENRKQGQLLSHLNIWKKISEMKDVSDDMYFTIFEDDVIFHNDWKALAPHYFENTPKDFDILFIGNQAKLNTEDDLVVQKPTFSTHAYIITYNGAKKLYKWLLTRESKSEIEALDEIFYNSMMHSILYDFIWYCWNGTKYISKMHIYLIYNTYIQVKKWML